MSKIKINTTQNIDIEYEIANLGDRILAWLIDLVVQGIYILIALLILSSAGGGQSTGIVSLILVPAALYHLVIEWLNNGRSLGKLVLRLKVIRIDGREPNLGNYLLRWMFRIIETNFLIFYGGVAIISIILSEKGQRLGDVMAGTTVIKMKKEESLGNPALRAVQDNYKPFFPQVSNLSDRDIDTLEEVLRVYRQESNVNMLNAAANRICYVLNLYPPHGMNADQFLRTILKDYYYIS